MKTKYLLLASLLCTILITKAQQPWHFHIAFEDGSGQRDTLWMIFDNTATVEGVDYQLGEGTPEYDPNAFNVFFYNMDVDSTKVKAYPYEMYPNMSTDEVFAINYTYPVIIRWDSSLFHATYLPTSIPMNYAIVLGDYQFAVLGIDTTSPYLHNIFMFSKDSLFCPEDNSNPNPIPLFDLGCLGFRIGYDEYLSVPKKPSNLISVFPNPAVNKVYFKGTELIKAYTIFNARGLKIIENELANRTPICNLSIDVNNLPSGIYFIQFINQLNQIRNEKIVVKK